MNNLFSFISELSPAAIERIVGCCVSVVLSLLICTVVSALLNGVLLLTRAAVNPKEEGKHTTSKNIPSQSDIWTAHEAPYNYGRYYSGNVQNGKGTECITAQRSALYYAGEYLHGSASGQGVLTVFTDGLQCCSGMHILQVHGRFLGGQLVQPVEARVTHGAGSINN